MERISALPKNRRKQWVNEGRMARLFAIMINNSLQNIWLHVFEYCKPQNFCYFLVLSMLVLFNLSYLFRSNGIHSIFNSNFRYDLRGNSITNVSKENLKHYPNLEVLYVMKLV